MNIAAIDLSALPSLLLSERAALPDMPGIYFALAEDNTVLYIGKARRLSERWKSTIHHRYAQLAAMGDIRLAWLSVGDEALLDSVEVACIEHFSPVLNKSALSRSREAGKMAEPPVVKMPRLRDREIVEVSGMGKIVGRFQKARLDYQSHIGRPVTIEEVARTIDISRQSLSDIENGNALPRYRTLAKLCKLYGVQPGDLLAYEERLARLLAVAQHNTNSRAEIEHAGVVSATPAAHS